MNKERIMLSSASIHKWGDKSKAFLTFRSERLQEAPFSPLFFKKKQLIASESRSRNRGILPELRSSRLDRKGRADQNSSSGAFPGQPPSMASLSFAILRAEKGSRQIPV